MGNDMNPFFREADLDVLGLCCVGEGNPCRDFVEQPHGAKATEDKPRHSAGQMAVPPAGRLQGRPKVAMNTSLAGLSVVDKKSVGARHPIVVKKMNDGDLKVEGRLINRRG